MSEPLFDLSAEYEAMLHQGIRLSGEHMAFFRDGRLNLLRRRTRDRMCVDRVLDFGCGIGGTTARLRELFDGSEVTGVDTSMPVLEAARARHGREGIRFLTMDELRVDAARYDLCYVNGVFHHIAPEQRPTTLGLIHDVLRPGGILALFENNPWNPGTRMVMARIPFDREARTFSARTAAGLMRAAGFHVLGIDSLFFFPRPLRVLRFAEPSLSWTRLGAQYLVLGLR